jgi:hypothetical protein
MALTDFPNTRKQVWFLKDLGTRISTEMPSKLFCFFVLSFQLES